MPRFGLAEHRKAARLVEVGGDLGEELVGRKPDRNRDAELALDAPAKRASDLAGAHAVQPLGAGQVDERLVDRERLDQRASGRASACAPRGRPRRISPCSAGSRRRVRAEPAAPRTSASPSGCRRCARRSRRSRPRRACRRRRSAACRRARDRRASRWWRRRRRNRHARCESVSSSRWRTSRGEPQAAAARRAVAARRRGSRGRSRGIRAPRAPRSAAQRAPCGAPAIVGRVDTGVLREPRPAAARRPANVSSTPARKAGSARGLANLVRADARRRRGTGRAARGRRP